LEGAFEQAEWFDEFIYGYKNGHRNAFLGWEIPTVFQSLNTGFSILLATVVAASFGPSVMKLKGMEASSLFKMAMGNIIIMGFGFFYLWFFAAIDLKRSGTSSMIWLVLFVAALLEALFASPVALSFILNFHL
jgi:dipeptide/tripeptide permease